MTENDIAFESPSTASENSTSESSNSTCENDTILVSSFAVIPFTVVVNVVGVICNSLVIARQGTSIVDLMVSLQCFVNVAKELVTATFGTLVVMGCHVEVPHMSRSVVCNVYLVAFAYYFFFLHAITYQVARLTYISAKQPIEFYLTSQADHRRQRFAELLVEIFVFSIGLYVFSIDLARYSPYLNLCNRGRQAYGGSRTFPGARAIVLFSTWSAAAFGPIFNYVGLYAISWAPADSLPQERARLRRRRIASFRAICTTLLNFGPVYVSLITLALFVRRTHEDASLPFTMIYVSCSLSHSVIWPALLYLKLWRSCGQFKPSVVARTAET